MIDMAIYAGHHRRKWYLTVILFAYRVIFHAFLSSTDLIFSKSTFSNTIGVSNSLDPDQDRHSVDPDLGSNCLQRL